MHEPNHSAAPALPPIQSHAIREELEKLVLADLHGPAGGPNEEIVFSAPHQYKWKCLFESCETLHFTFSIFQRVPIMKTLFRNISWKKATPATRKQRSTSNGMLAITAVVMMGWMTGCATQHATINVITNNQQIACDFEATLPEAVDEYCTNMKEAYTVLEGEVDQGINEMHESSHGLVVDIDGYWNRTKGNEERDRKVQEWLQINFDRFLVPALNRYFEAYKRNVEDLESSLLIRTTMKEHIADAQKTLFPRRVDANPADLSGNLAIKAADDALGFVPFAGDAYDLYKGFVYDKRIEDINKRADDYVDKVAQMLHESFLKELKKQQPDSAEVLKECRNEFNPSVALDILEKERQ